MKNLKILAVLFLFFASTTIYKAQFSEWINKKQAEVEQKVNNKINQKTSQAIDKAIDAPEKIIQRKSERNKAKSGKCKNSEENSSANNTSSNSGNNGETIEVENEAPNENGETIIQTNIKCESGKKIITKILKEQDGVFAVDINIKNGEIKLNYSSDGTPYTEIIKLINENGFEADGNLAKGKKYNCK